MNKNSIESSSRILDVSVLNVSKYLQYSLFGSILTVGAMIGAAMSGRISDLIGRRAVNYIFFLHRNTYIF